MCEFTQREYSCGHFRFIAARWCNHYRVSHRRCTPDVAHFEYRRDEVCGLCQPHEMPGWFHDVQSRAAPVKPVKPYPSPRATMSSYPPSRPSRTPRRQPQPKTVTKRPPIPLFSATVKNRG